MVMSQDFSPTLTLGFGPSCNQIYQAKTEELSSWNIPKWCFLMQILHAIHESLFVFEIFCSKQYQMRDQIFLLITLVA